MCVKRPQFRQPAYVQRRVAIREFIRGLTSAPDYFSWAEARVIGDGVAPAMRSYALFDWLEKHHFIARLSPGRRGKPISDYYLTEQAIRWLDWVGFDWSTVRQELVRS